MKVSQKGIELIKYYEGFRAKTYVCPGGRNTIGYGHTGPVAFEGNEITEADAVELLINDLKVREKAIDEFVWVKLNQNQFDALVSLVYNIGLNAFFKSTMRKLLNNNRLEDASYHFLLWNKGGNPRRVLPGLVKRRAAEKELFTMKDI